MSLTFGPRWLMDGLSAVLIAVGVLARVLPLVQGNRVLLRQPTEDGFLMLTVARNIAIGLGMSTAQGTIPTNGVQPLATLLDAACFRLAGGDRAAGVALVMALSVVISVLALVAMIRLGDVLFATVPGGRRLALLASALWFASPVVLAHSMNGLETGLYFLTLLIALRYFLVHAIDPDRELTWREIVGLGARLGLAFWARNDAIFLAAAIGLARLGIAWRRPTEVWARRLHEMALVALVMTALAAPWMIFNQARFGSVVPISGKAEAAEQLGVNLPLLPAKLAEFLSVVGAIPSSIEVRHVVQFVCVLALLAGVSAAIRIIQRGNSRARAAAAVGLAHAALLAIYYGVFFGAGHFLSRYTSPLSILTAFLTVAVAAALLRANRWAWAFPLALALVALGLDLRHYRQREEHMHFQVAEWIDEHVPPETWVGAIQSGTVGFFHDRTINLDGKTNPDALRARFANQMRGYIVDSRITYLADWIGIAEWERWLAPTFAVTVNDPAHNLAVLERRAR